MRDTLAIIIPAYKTRFLAKALQSIARQSVADAHLYIFDDCSPEPVERIVRECLSQSRIPWTYERFEQNMGGRALTKHYDRCVQRTTEDWIWLFSDDDVMEPECVANLRAIIAAESPSDVYCFDSYEIDADDRVISLHPTLPDWESWKQHAYFIFRRCRFVPQQAVVFSRRAYQKLGAFIEFPLAWGSDFATTMALAVERGVRRIPRARVQFRTSGENLSSANNSRRDAQKLQAVMQFTDWFLRQIATQPDPDFQMPDTVLKSLAHDWLKQQLVAFHVWYSPRECLQTARFLKNACGEPAAKAWIRMLKLNFDMMTYSIRMGLFRPRA